MSDLEILAMHAVELIAQIAATVVGAKAGHIKPTDALAHIGTLHQSMVEDRAAADKALAAKFRTTHVPTGDEA